jgi:hypothetical protein
MRTPFALAAILLLLASLACGSPVSGSLPTIQASPFVPPEGPLYGFFPSPPEASLQSILDLYDALGQNADAVLLQQNIPWEDFAASPEAGSQAIEDMRGQYALAHQNGLEVILVVDPLNGLNRRQFMNLPAGWEASFAAENVRRAFANFTLRLVREFQPRYLGLASEINTYADAHPADFPHYLSLYAETYDQVKAEAPETRVFATFQWEDLNNLIPGAAEGRSAYTPNWDQVEAFEPRLDLWVISSYPFVVFPQGADIPADYYTPLLERTAKPLAVAEGGFTSRDVGPFRGTPQDQVDYLESIHSQIGERLVFWIYLLLRDFNLESYAREMERLGRGADVSTLGMFASVGLAGMDGTPKPALKLWNQYREE